MMIKKDIYNYYICNSFILFAKNVECCFNIEANSLNEDLSTFIRDNRNYTVQQ